MDGTCENGRRIDRGFGITGPPVVALRPGGRAVPSRAPRFARHNATRLVTAALALAWGTTAWSGTRHDSGSSVYIDAAPEAPTSNDPEWPIVHISIDSVRVVEGDSGVVGAAFTVRLSSPLGPQGGTLKYSTQNRTARLFSDYLPVSGTLVLNPRDVSYSIVVPVVGDTILEGNERFALRLSSIPPGTVLDDSVGIGTIVNDERAPFVLTLAGLSSFYGALSPAFGDANGDGFPDLPPDINDGEGRFYRSQNLAAFIQPGFHHGSAWCDYDRDGRSDLVILPYAEAPSDSMPLELLHNLGGDQYEDVAARLGMDVIGHGETAVWGDFDGDGWPDLFTPFYAHLPPYRSFLWRNRGDGTFTDVADSAGVALRGLPESLKPEGADAADWNGDGTLDLYCASHLFLNDGAGHFTDVREEAGLPQLFDEGAKFVDIDNDGDLDLYLRALSGPRLFRNDGGRFTEVTAAAGLPPRPLFWGDSWADVDNDGDNDLLLVNVSPYPTELYLNQGDGTFVADGDFAASNVSNFLSAWADVDGDGDLDGALGATDRRLLLNLTDRLPAPPRSTLWVWVLDADGLTVCYGAIARLSEVGGGPGTIQTRVVDGGSGYLTQGGYPLHFAGLCRTEYTLEVRYPGPPGGETVVGGITIDPDQLASPDVFVFRDGRVQMGDFRPRSARSPASPKTDRAAAVPAPDRSPAAALAAPWPVPAAGVVNLPVRLEGRLRADLSVHDITGRRVRMLARDLAGEGSHALTWDLRDDQGRWCPNGVYFVQLALDGRTAAQRRVIVLR
jgi:VCBS repeat protein/Calx-beta domain-containing protein